MPESNQKLDRFTAAILREAAAESDQAMAAYEKKRTKELAEAKKKVGCEARAYLHAEITRLRADYGRQVAQRMQETKRTLFQRRNEIAGGVFDEVRQKITAYTASEQYAPRLREILLEALGALRGSDSVTVYLRSADQNLIPSLREAAAKIHMTFLDGDFQLGGLIVEAPEMGLRVDSSFDSRMEELNGHFAELFGISLSDAE